MKYLIYPFLLFFINLNSSFAQSPEKGNYLEQIDSLKQIPPSFETNFHLGKLYKQTGNFKQAIFYFQETKKFHENIEVQKNLASLWLSKGYPEKAIGLYKEIIKKDSTDLYSKFLLAKLYAKLHKSNKSIALLQELEKKDPKNPRYTYLRANLIIKNMDDRLDTYLLSYKKDTTWLKPIHTIANIYNLIKFYDSSLIFINKGLKLRPTHSNLLMMKVKEEYRQKNFKKMNKTLKILDSLKTKPFFTHKMLGLNYYFLKKYPLALSEIDKALKLDSKDPDLYLYKSYVFFDQKIYKKAELMLNISIKLKHNRVDKEYYQLALIAKKRKNFKKAIDLFYKAYKENSKNSEALFQWAYSSDLYYKDKKVVLQAYQKFLKKSFYGKSDQINYAEKRVQELKEKLFMEK